MDLDPIHEFERQIDINSVPSRVDNYTNIHPTWTYPNRQVAPGATQLSQATLAAYKTIPADFSVHVLQAQFLKGADATKTLHYEVQRVTNTSKFACRHVQVKQNGEVVAVVTINFVHKSVDNKQSFEMKFLPPVTQETTRAAAQEIDPELDDFDWGRPDFAEHIPRSWPKERAIPPFSGQRLSISGEENIFDRVYRCKLRIKSALSGQMGQILGLVCLSDVYLGDAALSVPGVPWGIYPIGDKKKVFPKSEMKLNTTLNHTLHFVRHTGWDVHEGVLFEIRLNWIKGTRAEAQMTIRDVKGELIATAVQETYFLLHPGAKSHL